MEMKKAVLLVVRLAIRPEEKYVYRNGIQVEVDGILYYVQNHQ